MQTCEMLEQTPEHGVLCPGQCTRFREGKENDTQMAKTESEMAQVLCEKNKILWKFHILRGPEMASMRWHLA